MSLLLSVFYFFAAFVGAIAIVHFVLRLAPAISHAVLGGEVARNSSIDGVRGIAATTVLLQHGLLGYGFNPDLTPGARFVEKLNHNFVHQAGSIAVSMFFMITAYLFCGRLLRQSGAFDVRTFIIGRAWRLIPLYLVFVTIIIVYSFINGGGLFQVPPVVLLKQIILALSFGFLPLIELNGMAVTAHQVGACRRDQARANLPSTRSRMAPRADWPCRRAVPVTER